MYLPWRLRASRNRFGRLPPEILTELAVAGCVCRPSPWLTKWGRLRNRVVPNASYSRAMEMNLNSPRVLCSCFPLLVPSAPPRILTLPPARVIVVPAAKLQRDRVTPRRPLHLNVHARIRKLQERQGMLTFGNAVTLIHGISSFPLCWGVGIC